MTTAGTVRDWLQEVADSSSSTDKDNTRMENLLHRMDFPKARVVLGCVYPEGYGKPMSIHFMAWMLLSVESR